MAYKVFDPHKSFLCLPIVWLTIVILASLSIILGWVITCHSEINLDLSYEGMNNFIAVFRLPLGISALIIPIVALLAANHRSEQTKEQIKVANAQNTFSNYYKHIEEFDKYISPQVSKNKLSGGVDIDIRYAHSMFFPKAKDGDYSLSENVTSTITKLVNIPIKLFTLVPDDLSSDFDGELFDECVSVICDAHSLINRNKNSYRFKIINGDDKEYGGSYILKSKSLIISCAEILGLINKICHFSHDYIENSEIDCVLDISVDKFYIYNATSPFSPKNTMTFNVASNIYRQLALDFLEEIKKL